MEKLKLNFFKMFLFIVFALTPFYAFCTQTFNIKLHNHTNNSIKIVQNDAYYWVDTGDLGRDRTVVVEPYSGYDWTATDHSGIERDSDIFSFQVPQQLVNKKNYASETHILLRNTSMGNERIFYKGYEFDLGAGDTHNIDITIMPIKS